MKSVVVWAWAFAFAPSGCYLKPAWSNGPVRSPEGVGVSLVGHMCWDDDRGHHNERAFRDLFIKLKIENPTDRVLHVNKDSVGVAVDDNLAQAQWYGPAVVDLKPHGSASLQWFFVGHTPCVSDRPFVITLRNALFLGERPISVANLEFKP